MIVLRHADVSRVLAGRDREVIEIVRRAYAAHDQGQTTVPHSSFLRFPGDAASRIIALPAFLGGEQRVAGLKWVSSFPANLAAGLPRASAVIVLNSMATGQAEAVIEASLISAKRTAAGAALAAELLGDGSAPGALAFVGCGVINSEVLEFLTAVWPGVGSIRVFDTEGSRAESFAGACRTLAPGARVAVASHASEALAHGDVVSIATTATTPHLDLEPGRPGAVVAHLSLRDVFPESILRVQNVVDDPDHACRELTSLQLAERLAGNRDFISASIGSIIRDPGRFRRDPEQLAVFSPFGLGMLDVAVAKYVLAEAARLELGVTVGEFHPGGHR